VAHDGDVEVALAREVVVEQALGDPAAAAMSSIETSSNGAR